MSPRPFIIERRDLPLRANLEDKVERAFEVVREERAQARVKTLLASLAGEERPFLQDLHVGLKGLLGIPHAKRSRGGRSRPHAAAEAAFKRASP